MVCLERVWWRCGLTPSISCCCHSTYMFGWPTTQDSSHHQDDITFRAVRGYQRQPTHFPRLLRVGTSKLYMLLLMKVGMQLSMQQQQQQQPTTNNNHNNKNKKKTKTTSGQLDAFLVFYMHFSCCTHPIIKSFLTPSNWTEHRSFHHLLNIWTEHGPGVAPPVLASNP